MARQVTINQSFYDKIDSIKEMTEEKIKEEARDIANHAVNMSPVKTGAFVTSFSIVPRGSGGGRSRSSHNKPLRDEAEAKDDARGQLMGDIESIEMLESGGFTLRNRAPHANPVERKYGIMASIRGRY